MKRLSWLVVAIVAALLGAYIAENGGLSGLTLPKDLEGVDVRVARVFEMR